MKPLPLIAAVFCSLFTSIDPVFAQGTAFSYQGRLNDGASPANGLYDLRFTVWDAPTNGNLVAGPLTNSATCVTNGLFKVTLDFGTGVFTGPARWLELDVQTNGGDAFTTLLPFQLILPVPYAVMANSASNLLGVLPVAQLSGTVPLAQLPGTVVTNNATGLTLNGTFSGNGTSLTSLNASQLSSGTVPLTRLSGITSSQLSAATWQLATNLNGGNAALASNVVSGIAITNAFITNSVFAGNGAGLTNLNATNLNGSIPSALLTSVPATNLTGTISLARLPSVVITNNAGNLTVGGTNVVAPLTVPPLVPAVAFGSIGATGIQYCVAVSGRYAYVCSSSGALQVYDVSNPSAPVLVGSAGTGGWASSVAVAGRYAYVVASPGTLLVFDVSTPSAPILVGSVGTGSLPKSVAVAGRYVYVVNTLSDTLQIFDVFIPSAPVLVGSVGTGGAPSSVVVSGRYVYVANYSSATLQVFDLSTPSAPILVGSVVTGGEPHSVAVVGRYAYVVNTGGQTLQIFDVSTPSAPLLVGSVAGLSIPQYVAVAGRYAYVMNGSGPFQIFDVSNPTAPVLVGSSNAAWDPNCIAVSGRYAYLADSYGLKVIDMGGAYIQQFEAGAVEVGTLQTRDNVTVGKNLDVSGGLTVSASARIWGGLGVDYITATNFSGNGGGLTNLDASQLASGAIPSSVLTSVPAASLTGTLPLAQLPGTVVTNNASNVTLSGAFSGDGSGLINVPASAISGGMTTNIAVLVPGGGTNTLCFTNGILLNIQ